MTISVDGGGSPGANLPSPKSAALQLARDVAGRAGLTELSDRATLMLRKPGEVSYQDNRFGDGSESAVQNAALLGKVTRTGGAYIPNWNFRSGGKVGVLRKVEADDTLRWNEPPEDEYAGGPLIEGAGTNEIPNPRCEGATAGTLDTTGVLPTGWTRIGGTDTQMEVVGSGTEDGWPYVDIRWNTTGTESNFGVTLAPVHGIGASASETWTLTMGLKVVGGTFTGAATQSRLRVSLAASFGSSYDSFDWTPTTTRQMWTVTETFDGTSIDALTPYLLFDITGAQDFTLRIYAPQCENLAYPTSPMLPDYGTLAVSTRGAETRNGGFQCERDGRAIGFEWDGTNGGLVSPAREYYKHSPVSEGCIAKVQTATTNKIRNPRAIGYTTGLLSESGVLPTYWGYSGQPGAINVIGGGVEGGADYVDIEITTPTAGFYLYFDENNRPDPSGIGVTGSIGVRIIGGSTANLTSILHSVRELSSGSTIYEHYTDIKGLIDSRHRRFTQPVRVADLGVSNQARHELFFGWAAGTVSLRLRIFWPQLENLPYPTLPALPPPGTTGEATRDADDNQFDLGDWFQNGEFTVYGEVVIPDANADDQQRMIFSFGNGATSDNYIYLSQRAGGWNLAVRRAGAFSVGTTLSDTWVPGERRRFAIRFKDDDYRMVVDGVDTALADNSGLMPSTGLDIMRFGNRAYSSIASSTTFHGAIEAFSLIATPLDNDELNALVGNS